MKKFLVITICILFAATASLAQTPKTETKPEAKKPETKTETKPALPTVDQILEKYEKASNNKLRGTKITSMFTKGTLEIPSLGVKGTIEIYEKAPGKIFSVQTIPGFGVINMGYDGQTGWSQDPSSGLRQMKAEEIAQIKRSSNFAGSLRSQYSKLELKGTEKVGDKDAYVIIATPGEGKPETFYFDTQTGLVIRQDLTSVSPMGEIPAKIFSEDYREFDGMMIPFTTRQVTSSYTAVIKIEEVKTNLAIDDAKFAMPKAQ